MVFEDLHARPTALGSAKKPPALGKMRRSNMMLNPLKLEHLNRIDAHEADMITLNLEDAIAPSRKKEALENIALFLSHLSYAKSFIIVRVNALDQGGAEEIAFLNSFSFDAVRVAKVKSQADIRLALSLLGKDKALHISLETKEAFRDLASFGFDSRLTTANLGILDLLSSLGLPQSLIKANNPSIDYILSKFLIDAKTANIEPISFMFQDYDNTQEFRTWCLKEKQLGFTSKACMGPKQVAIANEIFGIDPKALVRAKHIKTVFETHAKQNINGFMDAEYGFIDEPIYRDALLILKNSGLKHHPTKENTKNENTKKN